MKFCICNRCFTLALVALTTDHPVDRLLARASQADHLAMAVAAEGAESIEKYETTWAPENAIDVEGAN